MEISEGFILKTTPYGNSRNIVHIYSLKKGYIECSTTVSHSRKQQLMPLLLCEFEFIPNAVGDLHKINKIYPKGNLSSINFDVQKLNTALLWGEILNTILKKESANQALYEYIKESVSLLDHETENENIITIIFLYRISSFLGFRPDISTYQKGKVFCISSGIFVSEAEKQERNIYAGPNLSEAIYLLHSQNIEDIRKMNIDNKGIEKLIDIFIDFYEIHLSVSFNKKNISIIKNMINKL